MRSLLLLSLLGLAACATEREVIVIRADEEVVISDVEIEGERGGRHIVHRRREHPEMEEMLHRFMERVEHLEERQRHMAEALERFMERVEKLEAEREKPKER